MKRVVLLLMTFSFLIGCQDDISNRREGMKPFDPQEQEEFDKTHP